VTAASVDFGGGHGPTNHDRHLREGSAGRRVLRSGCCEQAPLSSSPKDRDMSTILTEQHSPFVRRALRTGALARIIELIVLWRRHAAAGRELRALCELDDHMLSDIGLTRSQLRREAARPFWRASVPSAMTSRSTSLRGDA